MALLRGSGLLWSTGWPSTRPYVNQISHPSALMMEHRTWWLVIMIFSRINWPSDLMTNQFALMMLMVAKTKTTIKTIAITQIIMAKQWQRPQFSGPMSSRCPCGWVHREATRELLHKTRSGLSLPPEIQWRPMRMSKRSVTIMTQGYKTQASRGPKQLPAHENHQDTTWRTVHSVGKVG